MSESTKKLKKSIRKKETTENSSQNTVKAKQKSSKKRKSISETEIEVSEKKSVKFTAETIDNEVESNPTPKKRKKSKDIKELAPLTEELEAEMNRPENVKNVVSKRQQKREKYEKLLAEKKVKCVALMQQKALNYLSRWKHDRQQWKFKKARQIWLQNHIFDSSTIPDEFWDTTLLYFGGSKGKIRKHLIDECIKIVEADEDANDDEFKETKHKRARELLQYLQE